MENECGVEEKEMMSDSSLAPGSVDGKDNSDYLEIPDFDKNKLDADTPDNGKLGNDVFEASTSDVDIDDAEFKADEIGSALDQDACNTVNDAIDIASDAISNEKAEKSELEIRCKELELKVLMFEGMLGDLKREVNTGVSENSDMISSLSNELATRAENAELKRLKSDFEHFSKRLKRVAKSEDSISAEVLDAAKVPPDVLEITYAKTLNDLYSAMTDIFGIDESSDIVEDIRDQVRQFSAGVDFFIFEEGAFRIQGLSNAINSKLVSVKQIHGTYVELFKLLNQYVPNYDSQDFRSFVETGSREYAVEKIVAHEKIIDGMLSAQNNTIEDLSNLTENMQFMAELQNNQLDDQKITQESVLEISEQMRGITKAINLHTKALKKLNEKFASIGSLELQTSSTHVPELNVDLSGLEGSVQSKADRDEVIAISNALDLFREEMNDTLGSISQGMQNSVSQVGMLQNIQDELDQLREEMLNKTNNSIQDLVVETETSLSLSRDPEQIIIEELGKLGSATLKQFDQQLRSIDTAFSLDDLSLILDQMEQKSLLTSFKKGRYIYFSLTGQ